jgi:hypothetical protein
MSLSLSSLPTLLVWFVVLIIVVLFASWIFSGNPFRSLQSSAVNLVVAVAIAFFVLAAFTLMSGPPRLADIQRTGQTDKTS